MSVSQYPILTVLLLLHASALADSLSFLLRHVTAGSGLPDVVLHLSATVVPDRTTIGPEDGSSFSDGATAKQTAEKGRINSNDFQFSIQKMLIR